MNVPAVDEGRIARVGRRKLVPLERQHLSRNGEEDPAGPGIGRRREGLQRQRAAVPPSRRRRRPRGGTVPPSVAGGALLAQVTSSDCLLEQPHAATAPANIQSISTF